MIKSEKEYQMARSRLKDEQEAINKTRLKLEKEGLTNDQVKRVLDPMVSFRLQLEEEVLTYEQIKRGNIAAIENFDGLGRSLIAMRISSGKSQKELADEIGMEQSNLSRLERNEYFGAKPELITKIIVALGYKAKIIFEKVA